MDSLAEQLEYLYRRHNRRACIAPDPLQFVYRYQHPRDRELVGLVASSLAYGRVQQISRSVEQIVTHLGSCPRDTLSAVSKAEWRRRLVGFKHRWTTGDEMADLLWGIGRIVRQDASLEAVFAEGRRDIDAGLLSLVRSLRVGPTSLLSAPAGGSACKRLHLYLRWMVRSDRVDAGVWSCVTPAHLVVPLDTHMHRIGILLGFTARKSADRRTAQEITDAFRRIAPQDPVRYDFALAKLGMGHHADLSALRRSARHRRAA